MSEKKWVYLFSELDQAEKQVGGKWDDVKALLGGKGANLAEMTRIGVPVPPGFTVTTDACNAYLALGEKFPKGMWEQELDALKQVEVLSGKKFGDPNNPLLVSCRSGAKFSMPGMMDTVLNIGLERYNRCWHGQSYRRRTIRLRCVSPVGANVWLGSFKLA